MAVPRKTRYKRRTVSQKPVLPVLADVIARSPTGDMTFLMTSFGKPFTVAGFGNWFRKRCNEAGLPQCSAHGLRKAGATLAAEDGATDRQLMALYDWTSEKQANVLHRRGEPETLGRCCRRSPCERIRGRTSRVPPRVPPCRKANDFSMKLR
jgi:hypothetical protein